MRVAKLLLGFGSLMSVVAPADAQYVPYAPGSAVGPRATATAAVNPYAQPHAAAPQADNYANAPASYAQGVGNPYAGMGPPHSAPANYPNAGPAQQAGYPQTPYGAAQQRPTTYVAQAPSTNPYAAPAAVNPTNYYGPPTNAQQLPTPAPQQPYTLPNPSMPANVVPSGVVPEGPVPQGAIPPGAVIYDPPSSGPQPSPTGPTVVPPNVTPGQGSFGPAPMSGNPYSATPYSATPYTATPYTATPYTATPYTGDGSCGCDGGCDSYGGSCGVGGHCGRAGCGIGRGLKMNRGCGPCDAGDACGGCGPCDGGPRWFGSLAGLYLTRDLPNSVQLTGLAASPTTNVLDTRDAAPGWEPGWEARVGRRLGQNWAVEGVFWSMVRFNDAASVRSVADDLVTPLDFGTLTAGGTAMTTIFNNARAQQVQRIDELYNIEANLLRQIPLNCSRFGMTALAGARYFRFAETINYGSAAGGTEFGENGGTTSAFYNTKVTNNLIGGQLGARMYYFATNNLRVYAMPKVGLMANQVNLDSYVQRGDGAVAQTTASTKNDFGLLSELEAGVAWQMFPRVSLYTAYRIVGVAGIALADDQIPGRVFDVGAINNIDSSGSMLLHGAVSGVQIAF